MTIEFRPEQTHVIAEAMQAGLIKSPEEVLDIGVEALRSRLNASVAGLSAEEWRRELHEWIHSHSTTTPLLSDDAISRDSIYRERGL